MSIDYIENHLDHELGRLDQQFEEGLISRDEYNDAVRDLEREAKDEYQSYREERIREIDEEMGWG